MDRSSKLVRMINNVVRFLIPWAVRGAGWLLGQYVISTASVFSGFPNAARRIADNWVDRAVAAGFPTRYVPNLYRAMVIVAWIDLILAWVISSYITIWLAGFVWRVTAIFMTALWLGLLSML